MTEKKKEKRSYLFFSSLSVVGWMQLVLQVVLPISLQMEMLNLPKLARTKLITLPSSHSMSTVVPSHPYFVRRSDPADIYVSQNIFHIIYQAFAWPTDVWPFSLLNILYHVVRKCYLQIWQKAARINIPI